MISHFGVLVLQTSQLLLYIYFKLKLNLLRTFIAAATAKPLQYLTLCDPIDSSPRGSPVPGILQARVLEWGARRGLSAEELMLLNCGVGEDS